MTARCPAAGILDQALQRQYRLPVRTRGMRADLRVVAPDGSEHRGAVHVGCGVHAATRLPGADEATRRWVAHELRGWARDVLPRPFAAAEGRYEIHVHRLSDDSQLARLADEATGTCFRLRDGRAVQCVRALGETRVTTTRHAWDRAEDGRDLPTHETVEVLDLGTGDVLRHEDRQTVWTPIAPHLPVARTVVERGLGGTRAWRITFVRPAILLPDGPVAPGRS